MTVAILDIAIVQLLFQKKQQRFLPASSKTMRVFERVPTDGSMFIKIFHWCRTFNVPSYNDTSVPDRLIPLFMRNSTYFSATYVRL